MVGVVQELGLQGWVGGLRKDPQEQRHQLRGQHAAIKGEVGYKDTWSFGVRDA